MTDQAEMSIAAILEHIHSEGGITLNCVTDMRTLSGFAVSMFKSREQILPAYRLTEAALAQYVARNADVLQGDSLLPLSPLSHLGVWINPENSMAYLDCVAIMETEDEARRIAESIGELAFYCLHEQRAIYVQEEHEIA